MPRQETSPYPLLPFHAIRALALLSTLVVAGVLSYFCAVLKGDGYKLPWTLLIMLAAAVFAFLNLVISYAVFCCARLSPLFNMVVSIPILIMWTIGFGLIVYNMYGTLANTCSKTNWANDDGMMVCRVYKTFFAFVVIGWLCQVALIIVDVRAKRTQSSMAKYDKMDESTNDVKLATLDHSRNTSTTDVPYGIENYRDRSNSENSFHSQRHVSPYGGERTQFHQVDDYRYQAPAQQHMQYQSVNFYQPTYDGIRLR